MAWWSSRSAASLNCVCVRCWAKEDRVAKTRTRTDDIFRLYCSHWPIDAQQPSTATLLIHHIAYPLERFFRILAKRTDRIIGLLRVTHPHSSELKLRINKSPCFGKVSLGSRRDATSLSCGSWQSSHKRYKRTHVLRIALEEVSRRSSACLTAWRRRWRRLLHLISILRGRRHRCEACRMGMRAVPHLK